MRSNAILRAVAEAAREFLQNDDWEERVTHILGMFGRAADVCRVCVFANVRLPDGRPGTQLRYEWVAPPLQSHLDRRRSPASLSPQPQEGSGFERWYRLLARGEAVYGPVSSFPLSERRSLEELGIYSSVAMPIFVNYSWWGFITFDDCISEREWTESELDALRTAASILAAGLERRQMAQALETSHREIHLLSDVLRALNATPDVDNAFPYIVDILRQLTTCDRLSIALINDDQTFTITSLDVAQPALGKGSRLPVSDSASAADILAGRMHLTPDLAEEADYLGENLLYKAGYRSRVNVPLRAENRVYGALNVAWKRLHGYTEAQLPTLQRIADAITLAIERTYYVRRERERRQSAERFYQAATNLASTFELGDILEKILDYLEEVTHYDSATILLPEGDYFRVKALRGFAHPTLYLTRRYRLQDRYFREMAETKRPVILEDASSAPEFEQWDEHFTIRGWVGVPLVSHNEVVGYLTLESRRVGAFTAEQVQAAELFAAYAAASIEHARLYNEAIALNKELREALQARTKLLHHVSHELRTPLTLILGVAELLESSPDLDQFSESTQQLINHLVREARQLRHMVNQVLNLKSLERQPMRRDKITVATWLEHIEAMWRPRLAEKHQRLVISAHPELRDVWGDENYLQQVVDNLMDNAHKYSPDGSSIYINVWPERDEIVFQVRDEGIGVSPEQLSNLFEEFYRIERKETMKTKGLGLGLALCRSIVERHGGRIWADSPGEGQGLIVTFSLPARGGEGESD